MDDQFKCWHDKCISVYKVCDGVSDCKYSDDEQECPSKYKFLDLRLSYSTNIILKTHLIQLVMNLYHSGI